MTINYHRHHGGDLAGARGHVLLFTSKHDLVVIGPDPATLSLASSACAAKEREKATKEPQEQLTR